MAPFGSQTAAALDRYLRVRRTHKRADSPALWVGMGGKSFGYYGLNESLRDRAKTAGVDGSTSTCCATPRPLVGCVRAVRSPG